MTYKLTDPVFMMIGNFTFHSSGKVITRADDSPEEEMSEFYEKYDKREPALFV